MRTFFISVLFLSLAGTIFPQVSFSTDIDDNIEKIQQAYKKIRDMKGSFTQINTIRDLDKTTTYKGQFFIKQPFRMIWMYTGKAEQDIYINNDTVLIYKRGDKQAYRGKFDRATYGQTPVALLSGFGDIKREFAISGSGNSLLLKPKNPLGTVTSISVTLSDEDFPIKSFTILDGRSNMIVIELKDVKLNTDLKDSLFEFSVPKSVKVYDYNP